MKVRRTHGGGLSPVVAGQLHTPTVEIEETVKEHHMHVKEHTFSIQSGYWSGSWMSFSWLLVWQ